MHARLHRVGDAQDIAVDVAAGGNRRQQRLVDLAHGGFEIRFDDAVQLEGLARGQPHGAVAVSVGDVLHLQELLRRADTGGNAQADHEGERLLHLFLAALGAKIAVVLQIHAVEFHQLRVILDDGAGDFLAQALGQGAAQIGARFLDAFVAGEFFVVIHCL